MQITVEDLRKILNQIDDSETDVLVAISSWDGDSQEYILDTLIKAEIRPARDHEIMCDNEQARTGKFLVFT